jgi:hypothetical protein
MYCLVAFYLTIKETIAPYKPFFKLLCIKLVIFFSFWQGLVVGYLVSSGRIKPSQKIAYADLSVGLPSLMILVEMAIFAIMHIFAFGYKGYIIPKNTELGPGQPQYMGFWRAILDSLNPLDLIKAFLRGMKWLFVGRKSRHSDGVSDKAAAYEPHRGSGISAPVAYDGAVEMQRGKFGSPERYAQLPDTEDPDFASRPTHERKPSGGPYQTTRFNEVTSYVPPHSTPYPPDQPGQGR